MSRTQKISVSVSNVEKRALLALAKLEARNPSETLRELVRRRAEELGVWDPSEDNATEQKAQ